MRKLVKLFILTALAMLLTAAFCTAADQAVANELSLQPGRHDVKVTKPGYKDYFAESYVTGGGLVNMAVDLKAAE